MSYCLDMYNFLRSLAQFSEHGRAPVSAVLDLRNGKEYGRSSVGRSLSHYRPVFSLKVQTDVGKLHVQAICGARVYENYVCVERCERKNEQARTFGRESDREEKREVYGGKEERE